MSNKNISSGIALECSVFSQSIGADKDLILINYSDFDKAATANANNRQANGAFGNQGGLTDIILKPGAIQYTFEGTDYSVTPSIKPEVREDGNLWYSHSLAFTVYSKSSKDRAVLLSLGKSSVIGVTRDRSTGLYELFGMDQGLRVTGIDRSYVGSQSSNFYQVSIATPEINVIRETSMGELSVNLNGVGPAPITPPTTPGGGIVYGDATSTVQGLVRVDTNQADPVVYLKTTADFLFELKTNKLTSSSQVDSNLSSTVKFPSIKAMADWVGNNFEAAFPSSDLNYYWRGDKTWALFDGSALGLDQVDNTSDLDKPVSTATSLLLSQKIDVSILDFQVHDEILTSVKQVFTLGPNTRCKFVSVNNAPYVKESAVNIADNNEQRWRQEGNDVELVMATEVGNYVYIEFYQL